MDDGWGGWGNLGGDEGRETMIRIYLLYEKIFNERKRGQNRVKKTSKANKQASKKKS